MAKKRSSKTIRKKKRKETQAKDPKGWVVPGLFEFSESRKKKLLKEIEADKKVSKSPKPKKKK